LASRSTEPVRLWLRDKHFPADVTILDGPQPGVVLVFVPSSSVAQKKAAGKTSPRHMTHLKRLAWRDLKIEIEFSVRTDDGLEDIESGLSAIVRQVLSNQHVQAFVSRSLEGRADVWLDAPVPGGAASQALAARVSEGVSDYLQKVGLALHRVYWEGLSVPSSAGVLRVVKVLEPVSAEGVAQHLQGHGYPSMPARWVKAQLDGLRRHGLVGWRNDVYVITAIGLSALPPSKGRVGSDIERALALGRRRW
jgi:hypothetical protein